MKKTIILVTMTGLLSLLMVSCAGLKHRRQFEIQRQIIAELKAENAGLKSDCASYIANNEMLIKKVNELQQKATTQSGLGVYGPRATLIAKLKKAGFAVLKRGGDTAVVMSIFKTSKSSLTRKDRAALEKVGLIIAQEIPPRKFLGRIDGYTDNRGSSKANKKLSLARAQSTKDFLVKACGFQAGQISIRGLGESNPMVSNKTRAGREKNRRIEIVVLTK